MSRFLFLTTFYIVICVFACIDISAQDVTDANPRLRMFNRIGGRSREGRMESSSGTGEMGVSQLLSMARGGGVTDRACNDTSGSFYFRKDSFYFYVGDIVAASDGSLMMCGQCSEVRMNGDLYRYNDRGYLMKCDSVGNVKWVRMYDSVGTAPTRFINYNKLTELRDGSWIMGGYTPGSDVNFNIDLIFTRADPDGGLIWSKVFKSRLWTGGAGSGSYYDLKNIIQDVGGDGDVYFSGSHWAKGKNVTRLNVERGSIVWSNSYEPWGGYSFDRSVGIDIAGDEILAFGTIMDGAGRTLITLQRINKNSGDTVFAKAVGRESINDNKLGFLKPGPLARLANGHYVVCGAQHGSGFNIPGEPANQAGAVCFDSELNFINAWSFLNYVNGNFNYSDMMIFPDGSGIFAMHANLYGAASDIYTIQFKGMSILKQRRKRYEKTWIGEGADFLRFPDGGNLVRRLLSDSAVDVSGRQEFLRMHVTDTSSVCLGINDFSTWVEPFTLQEMPWRIERIERGDLVESINKTLKMQSVDVETIPGCLQVSRCDSLDLTASSDTICRGSLLTLTVHKNSECGAAAFFEYDTAAVRRFTQVSDSTYQLTFKNSWKGRIYANISGCASYSDSVELVVLSTPDTLDLGADTAICSGNQVLLQAQEGFASYKWQDGSVGSFFKAEMPGVYHVVADNGCGTFYRDTVVIAARASAPLHLGADQEICRYDFVRLSAPADFLTYNWSPAYYISDVSASEVVVQPEKDTAYVLKAEKPEGCFSFDTVYIKVKPVSQVNLGRDTALCEGDSLILNAGAGFASYLWNTGASSRELIIRSRGNYSATATAVNGCVAADTMVVTEVFALPDVDLGNDSVICKGTPLQLYAGRFTAYKWSTGEHTDAVTINSTGLYAVQVTDVNGCMATDTLVISREISPPAGFLPADTAICSYESYRLSASSSYYSYRWSTGVRGASVDLSAAGTYWLQVSDQYGCKGVDTIRISQKNCIEGFYIPSAFTPNDDGRNDVFKPLIFGNVEQYRFTVYNRWGQVVFSGNEPGKGWDGGIKGQRQDMQVFVWICNYRLRGSGMVQKTGTVTIVR